MSFTHLHTHSEFSLLDGASKVPELCDRVKELGQEAVAITDHGWMAAAVKLVAEAERAEVKPILGSEVYMATQDRLTDPAAKSGDNYHLTLLCQNQEGYRNLVRLTSLAHLQGFHYKPRIDHHLLEEHAGGLIVLSGCIAGELNQRLIEGNEKEARRLIDWYARVFDDRFFLEVMYHGCKADGEDIVNITGADGDVTMEEYELASWIADEGRKRGIPVVATNDAHYLTREDGDAHDTLLCLQSGGWKHKEERLMYPGFPEGLFEFYVKSEEEMKACAPGDYWDEACDNTQVVVEMVEDDVLPKHGLIMPRFQIPKDVGFSYWRQTGAFL